jgi:hypothetical protein
MTDRLGEIRQRAEAATPGPWEFDSHVHGEKGCRCFSHFVVTGYTLTNPFPCCDETAEAKGASNDCTSTVVTFEDATFITHARQDIPYLLAEIERLRALFARVECTDQYENAWNKYCSVAYPGERDSWCPNCITVGEINGTQGCES